MVVTASTGGATPGIEVYVVVGVEARGRQLGSAAGRWEVETAIRLRLDSKNEATQDLNAGRREADV